MAASQFDAAFLEAHWDLRLAPPPAGSRVASFADLESEALFGGYCAADFLPEGTRFDLIAVQGFARVACLRRALALLRPQGGLLVLPQAQRPAYRNAAALVPDHWVRLTDAHQLGTTHVWVSLENP